MKRSSRHEYAAAIGGRYRAANKGEKGRILSEFCAATGYARTDAIGLLNRPPAGRGGRVRRARPRRSGAAEAGLLRACWELADGICGKRLAPFLGELLAGLAASAALPAQATPEAVARAIVAACAEELSIPAVDIVLEFTQHAADEWFVNDGLVRNGSRAKRA